MSQPVHVMFLMNNTEAWYQLSQEAKDSIMNKITASLKEAGAEVLALCDATWSTDSWQMFGLIKFPDIEALQKHRKDTNNLDWGRYTEGISVLGTDITL
jgi:hypothetical protein